MAARAWLLVAVRLGLLLALMLTLWLIIRATTKVDAFPPNNLWATLGLLPANVTCLLLVRRFYRDQGRSLPEALDIRKGRIGRDLLWGLLWLLVLNIPFTAAIGGAVFVMYGQNAATAFAEIFFDPSAVVPMGPLMLLVLSLVSVVPFMLINAPTEELVYRGYAMDAISSRWGAAVGVGATSLLFGVQHILFASSLPECSSISSPSPQGA